ncbi:MAG TPA: energy transducer TonB [Opitutaceae bacterium]|nr:energy transducer TonB [Opitutaceae bacterium]
MKLWIPVALLAVCLAGCESTEGLQAINPVTNEVHFTGDYYKLSDVDQAPTLIDQVPPEYPSILQKGGVEGKVQLQIIVDPKGVPQQVQVSEATHTLFVQPAIDAVRHWRYRPGLKGGQPVATQIPVTMSFQRDRSLEPESTR